MWDKASSWAWTRIFIFPFTLLHVQSFGSPEVRFDSELDPQLAPLAGFRWFIPTVVKVSCEMAFAWPPPGVLGKLCHYHPSHNTSIGSLSFIFIIHASCYMSMASDVPSCLYRELNQTRIVIASVQPLSQNVHCGKPFIFNANHLHVLIYFFQVVLFGLHKLLAQRWAAPSHTWRSRLADKIGTRRVAQGAAKSHVWPLLMYLTLLC